MKKFLPYILILAIIAGAVSGAARRAEAEDPKGVCMAGGVKFENITKKECQKWAESNGKTVESWYSDADKYTFLAPLTEEQEKEGFNPGEPKALGKYLNMMINIIIGLAAVMAILMIVIGGIEYMTSELVHSKEAGRHRMTEAVLGLILALGAWALLNTINPDLLKSDLTLKDANIVVTLDAAEAGDINEGINQPAVCGAGSTTPNAATGFCMSGTPTAPRPSGGVANLVNHLKNNPGSRILQIDISTSGKAAFRVTNQAGTITTFEASTLGFGANGIAEIGQGKSGDMKTPKGNWKISEIRKSENQSQRINNQGGRSMGGVALMLNVGNRGIAIHGNSGNKSSSTAGCVLMSNDDLFAIAPYVQSGTPVNIW